MSFTMLQLRDALARAAGRQVSDADAALAYVQIDQGALRAEHAQRVRWERWDGGPVNGASAEYVRSRLDYGGGEVYLVYVDDQLVFLQPHDPESQDYGPIAEEDLRDVAERHVGTIVSDFVFDAAVSQGLGLLPTPVVQPMAGPAASLVVRQAPPSA